MGTNECSQPASKSFWDSQDFGAVSMVFKMAHFRKSTGPQWVKYDALKLMWRQSFFVDSNKLSNYLSRSLNPSY